VDHWTFDYIECWFLTLLPPNRGFDWISASVADYVFLVDVDFIPSANLPAIIHAHAARLFATGIIASPSDLTSRRIALVVAALSSERFGPSPAACDRYSYGQIASADTVLNPQSLTLLQEVAISMILT
jgi:hypothetical protein